MNHGMTPATPATATSGMTEPSSPPLIASPLAHSTKLPFIRKESTSNMIMSSSRTNSGGGTPQVRSLSRIRSGILLLGSSMNLHGSLSDDDEDENNSDRSTSAHTFHLTEVASALVMKKKMRKTKKIVGWTVKEVEIGMDSKLPFELKFNALINNLNKNIHFPDSEAKAMFEKHFDPNNELNRRIIENSFWFVFSVFFQDHSEVCERFISVLAKDVARFSLTLGRQNRDVFFEVYHLAVSYCILKAFRKHFSGSKKEFTTNFKTRVYELICEVFLGIRYKRDFLHIQRMKYFPKKSEDTFLEKLIRKQQTKKNKMDSSSGSKAKKKEDFTSMSRATSLRPDSPPEGDFYSSSEEEDEIPDEMEEIENASTRQESVSDPIQKLGLDENYHCLPKEVLEQENEEIENMKKKMKMSNKATINPETGKKQKQLSPRMRNLDYVKHLSHSDIMKEKYWGTFSMSPLMMRALGKPPPEFSLNYTSPEMGKNKVRLINKDGFSKPVFFGSLSDPQKLLNNVKKFQKVWHPDSLEEVGKVKERLKTNKELKERNTKEAQRDIRWIKGSTKEELKQIEKEKSDVLKNKETISTVCSQILKKRSEGTTSRVEKRYQGVESHNFKGTAFASVIYENYTDLNKKLTRLDKLLSATGDRCFITKEQHLKEEAELHYDLDTKDPPKAHNVSLFDYLQ
ncbi:hypothetical protein C9374_003062 [Naegleria lovaniensis]|uniref:Uncharacterized protein n=1 Tax=Naegleria lovaniensis TaxID=51637 RepID=A0AA88KKM1_NAELO|nr:uncharacterized protein C9374_003062 [Naegleria lovaniensis]KAG2385913.1 hypothetical protein C9374_003062 [Naegleria lovaniensis]